MKIEYRYSPSQPVTAEEAAEHSAAHWFASGVKYACRKLGAPPLLDSSVGWEFAYLEHTRRFDPAPIAELFDTWVETGELPGLIYVPEGDGDE